MKKIIKLIFKYGFLSCYFILALVLILEACMPGDVSAGQSDIITETITGQTGIGSSAEFIKPTSIKILTNNEIYGVGSSINIECEILPKNASKKTIKYELDSDIASINSNGSLTFNKEGKVKLKVWIDEYEDIYDVVELEGKIIEIPVQKLSIHTAAPEFNVGNSYQLHAIYTPKNTTSKSVIWESLNEDVALIDQNGKMTCLKEGKVDIKLTSKENDDIYIIKSFEITTFVNIPVEQLILKPNKNFENNVFSVYEDEVVNLNDYLNIIPSNANHIDLKWEAEDNLALDILQNGYLKAFEGSKSLINVRVYLNDNPSIFSEIKVKVISKKVNYDVDNQMNVVVNSNDKIIYNENTIFPNNYEIKYLIDDNTISTVDDAGIIYGIKKGKTTCHIVLTSSDGSSFIYDIIVNVINPPKPAFYLLIRKGIGHFGAFMILSLIAFGVIYFFFNRKIVGMIISLVVGFSLAGVTEIIQLSVKGRTGTFDDVLIDFSGYLVGTVITVVIFYLVIFIKLLVKRKDGNYEK